MIKEWMTFVLPLWAGGLAEHGEKMSVKQVRFFC